jgi:phage tail sheath protein FI
MTLPGTVVTVADSVPARTAPTDLSVWFIAALADRGPLAPVLVTSIDDYIATFGDRVSYGIGYDALDAYFHEGGSSAYVSRVVGPTPVSAHVDLSDAVPAVSLHVTAKNPGEWGNSLDVAVVAGGGGGTFQIRIKESGTVVEQSDDLTTQADAVAWSAGSKYVTITLGVGTAAPVVVGDTPLASGTDDRGAITDADWATAINRFSKTLGPGQVSMPGRTTSQAYSDQLAHAAANNRIAILDAPDTADVATLVTTGTGLQAADNGRYGGVFVPWAVVPGLVAGTTRTVPYSAIEAGIIARNDNAGLSPNIAAAGINGQSRYALSLSQDEWADSDRETLNDDGVNVVRIVYGGVRTYGFRTVADPTAHPDLLQLSNSRLLMAIQNEGEIIGERFVFAQIDGKGFAASDLQGSLVGESLLPLYNEGSLYGNTPADAFFVDTGPTVNTPELIAAGKLAAIEYVRLSPFAELVPIQIITRPITEAVS